MFAVSRNEGQRVRLEVGGLFIWITLLEVGSGRRARLVIDAPDEVNIRREEQLSGDETVREKKEGG